jgi:hypothetical protein
MKLSLAERRVTAVSKQLADSMVKEACIENRLAPVIDKYATLLHPCLLHNILLKLPREIRDMVYEHFLPSNKLVCNGLGLAQIHSSTSWDSSCTVIYICSSPHLR